MKNINTYKQFINEELNLNPFRKNIKYKETDWNRMLKDSAIKGDIKDVETAIEKGADIKNHEDALLWAVMNDHLQVVKYLVEKGANIHAHDDAPLRHAILNDYPDIIKYIIDLDGEYILKNKPKYIPEIIEYIPDELKEKYPHLFAASDMDLL